MCYLKAKELSLAFEFMSILAKLLGTLLKELEVNVTLHILTSCFSAHPDVLVRAPTLAKIDLIVITACLFFTHTKFAHLPRPRSN